MDTEIFDLIKKIVERNNAAETYSLEIIFNPDSGMPYLTCDNTWWLFSECSSNWMFSDVSDKEATTLLIAAIEQGSTFSFEILCHLSRLMAIKGELVGSRMDDIISTTDWSSYASPTFLLSYLATKADGVDWILRLLDVVPNDARDGLFTACWYRKDYCVQSRLYEKFEGWVKDSTWGGGDREGAWLARFLGKWISEKTFSCENLKNLIEWHFQSEHKLL